MFSDTRKALVLDCCRKLYEHNLTIPGDVVSLRTDDGMLIAGSGKNADDMTEQDVRFVGRNAAKDPGEALHLAIYGARPDINAIITNHAPFCTGIARRLKVFPATLDDMAQIIGPTAKVAPSDNAVDVLKTLSGRNACLIKNGGVIATGRTLDEAFTGSLVLEKGALCYVGSSVIGKPVRIGLFDAVLMRLVYKLKYSKKDQAAKLKEQKQGG